MRACLLGPKALKIYPRKKWCAHPWSMFVARKNSPVNLLRRKLNVFPSAGGGAFPASTQARRRSGGLGSQGCGGDLLRAEEARRRGSGEEEGASPAPLFIGGRGNCARYHAARIACSARTLWPSCGRAGARVGKPQKGHRIFCACACAGFEEATRIRLGAVCPRWIRARRIKVM